MWARRWRSAWLPRARKRQSTITGKPRAQCIVELLPEDQWHDGNLAPSVAGLLLTTMDERLRRNSASVTAPVATKIQVAPTN